jgi:hypothetical protein
VYCSEACSEIARQRRDAEWKRKQYRLLQEKQAQKVDAYTYREEWGLIELGAAAYGASYGLGVYKYGVNGLIRKGHEVCLTKNRD